VAPVTEKTKNDKKQTTTALKQFMINLLWIEVIYKNKLCQLGNFVKQITGLERAALAIEM
jgi:hypothetical protein